MKRVNNIGNLLEYNATGAHWITATTTQAGSGLTQSEVEYAKIKEIVDGKHDAYFIAIYSSELELLAYYSDPRIEGSFIEAFLHPNMIEETVNGYKIIKEKIKLYNDSYKFLLYFPGNKQWYDVKYKDFIPIINKTGFYFYLRIINSDGKVVDTIGSKKIEDNRDFIESQGLYKNLLFSVIDGASIGEGASSFMDLI